MAPSSHVLQWTLGDILLSAHILQRTLGDMPQSSHILQRTLGDILQSSHILQRTLGDIPPSRHILQRTLADIQQSWHIPVGSLGDMPRLEIGNWICRTNYKLWEFAVFHVSSSISNRIKHSVARHDALSNRASTLSRVMMLYPIEQALCRAS